MEYDPFVACFWDCEKMKCVCCGKTKWTIDGILLPYGSEFDQELICDSCLVKIVDPYVKDERRKCSINETSL